MIREGIEVIGVAALTAICFAIYVRVYLPWRVRRYVWRMDIGFKDQPKILIDCIPGESTEIYRRPSTGYGAAVGTSLVVNSLNSAQSRLISRLAQGIHVPPVVLFASDPEAKQLRSSHDIVVIGGPKNNDVCRDILTGVGCQEMWPGDSSLGEVTRGCLAPHVPRVGVATQENRIWWYGTDFTGDVRSSSEDSPNISTYSGTDYGVVLRIPNPFAPPASGLRAVVLFGSQTFGVIGATRALLQFVDGKNRRTKHGRALRDHQNLAMLVKVTVDHGKLRDPDPDDIHDCRELPKELPTIR